VMFGDDIKSACSLCGADAKRLYTSMVDDVNATSGRWNLYRCAAADCGLAALRPPPSTAESLAANADHSDRNSELEAELSYLPFAQGGRLLEVGCGDCADMRRLQALGWQVIGTEFAPAAVAAAQAQGLDVRLGSAQQPDLDRASFDAIVLNHSLQCAPEPLAELRHCHSLLKPGGRVLVLTPNLDGRGHQRWQRNWHGLWPPRHQHLFGAKSLIRITSESGFTVERCTTTGRPDAIELTSLQSTRAEAGKAPLSVLVGRITNRFYKLREARAMTSEPLLGNELLLVAIRA